MYATASAMIRRLYLGSVSSLSFEEEENEFCCARKNQNGDGNGVKQNGEPEAGLNMELHEMLTDRLYEQVDSLLRCSSYFCHPTDFVQRLLRATLSDAVHHILRLSEDEPYGVRGATIVVRIKDADVGDGGNKGSGGGSSGAGGVHTVGNIAVDKDTVSTFRLILVLEEQKRLGVSIKNWLHLLTGSRPDRVIGPRFTLRKEKLYRSESGSSLESIE